MTMLRRWILLLWSVRNRLRLTWNLMTDKRVPRWQKAIPFLPFIYILSPFNLFTFTIPIIGQLEDALLIMVALDVLERVVDKNILAQYQQQQFAGPDHDLG
jgi:uncharacterized membrane protein YkvA (DUF1232 family)